VTAAALLAPVEAPDYAEPLEAWRVWRVVATGAGYRLASVVKSALWPAGEALVAECLRPRPLMAWFGRRRRASRPVPDDRCECGIYGATLGAIGDYLTGSLRDAAAARVLGRVSLWGTVIECERGFRASHAYPRRIYVPADSNPSTEHGWEELAAGLDVYGVPVELLPARCSEAIGLLAKVDLATVERSE
jgi:hypothetical protein